MPNLKYFINTVFRDKIVDVKPPREDWFEYNGKRSLEAYSVMVTYKYAGPKNKIFYVDDGEDIDENFYSYSEADQNMLRTYSRNETLKYAKEFYSRVLERMQQRKRREKTI